MRMEQRGTLLGRLASIEKIIRETPVVRLFDERLELYAKLDFLNGIGSIKDRPALRVLKGAIERGDVGPDTTIVESSSGNFACALATFCRILELDFIPVIDPNVSPLYEAHLRLQCARVVKVEQCDDTGGYLKTRLATVHGLLKEISVAYWTNQYENRDSMAAHYHLTGAEIYRAAPNLDYVFIGVSTAGTLAGVSRRLKELNPAIRVIAVDAEGSVIFGQPPKKRWISGIGSSISPPLLTQAIIDDVVIVPEPATVLACHELLNHHGLFVGGSTGTVYSAIQSYSFKMERRRRPRVLFLCCDRGTAYLHTIFDPRWVTWRTSEAEVVHQVATSSRV